MNKPITLRDKLRTLVETDARPRPSLDLLSEELRSKSTVGFRPLALLDSVRLDLALFFHKYFAATLIAALLLAGGSAWIAFSALGPASPAAVMSSQEIAASVSGQKLAIVVPTRHVSSKRTQRTAANLFSLSAAETHERIASNSDISAATNAWLDDDLPVDFVEPRELPRIIPSAAFVPIGVGVERLQLVDAPLDYSGLTASVSFEQPGIPVDPAHPEFAATSANDLNYQAGYRFDRFQEAGIGYSQHIYRQISSTTVTWEAYNPATGKITYTHQTTWQYSDNPISLPGIYYTFHANDLEILGIEPFATGFASKPSAGFLWRASAGLEWNPWDNLSAVLSYSREQLNSGTYTAPQNVRNFFDFGLSYRLLP